MMDCGGVLRRVQFTLTTLFCIYFILISSNLTLSTSCCKLILKDKMCFNLFCTFNSFQTDIYSGSVNTYSFSWLTYWYKYRGNISLKFLLILKWTLQKITKTCFLGTNDDAGSWCQHWCVARRKRVNHKVMRWNICKHFICRRFQWFIRTSYKLHNNVHIVIVIVILSLSLSYCNCHAVIVNILLFIIIIL